MEEQGLEEDGGGGGNRAERGFPDSRKEWDWKGIKGVGHRQGEGRGLPARGRGEGSGRGPRAGPGWGKTERAPEEVVASAFQVS